FSASAFAALLLGSRVRARRSHPCPSMCRTTAPPCLPVAPVTSTLRWSLAIYVRSSLDSYQCAEGRRTGNSDGTLSPRNRGGTRAGILRPSSFFSRTTSAIVDVTRDCFPATETGIALPALRQTTQARRGPVSPALPPAAASQHTSLACRSPRRVFLLPRR